VDTKFDKKDIEAGKGMAVLSYIIALIPYFAEKKNPFVRFHAVQGINILILAAAYWIAQAIIVAIVTAIACAGSPLMCLANWGIINTISTILWLGGMAITALDIVGLVYAATGRAKLVPILGKIRIIQK
jgi:uncharacterized membrane protein